QFLNFGVQLFRFSYAINQSKFFRFFSADELTRYKHLKGCLARNVSRQCDTWRRTKKAQVDATDRKLCGACGHSQIAHRDKLAAGCGGNALHSRNDWHGQPVNAQHHLRTLAEKVPVVLQRWLGTHLFKIMTCTKRFAL